MCITKAQRGILWYLQSKADDHTRWKPNMAAASMHRKAIEMSGSPMRFSTNALPYEVQNKAINAMTREDPAAIMLNSVQCLEIHDGSPFNHDAAGGR